MTNLFTKGPVSNFVAALVTLCGFLHEAVAARSHSVHATKCGPGLLPGVQCAPDAGAHAHSVCGIHMALILAWQKPVLLTIQLVLLNSRGHGPF